MDKSAVKLFNSPSMFNIETTWEKVHAKNKKVADGLTNSPFRALACQPYRSVGRLKKKRVTLEQLALEHPWNTEEEKKDLLS